jgi:pyruvate/2-oxoglutarate dehydrogenase complex dihydrolipoamide dehydrogenase (E3) component
MPEERTYDVIVLGAGSTGENVADRAVQGGLTACVVEGELVGGECSYYACMPSKALLRGGQVLAEARAVAGAAQAVTGELDVAKTLARRDSFTSHWKDDGQVQWLAGANIDLVRGHGRLSGEREVTVTAGDGVTTVLHANQAVVICTGSTAFVPPIDGLAGAAPWTAREATAVAAVPPSIVILGGGVIGVEMATAFDSFGAEVTVVEGGPRLLATYEEFVSAAVEKALSDKGVQVLTGARATRVERSGDTVTLTTKDGRTVTAAQILVAVGRKAGTTDIGLDVVGLEPGAWLEVDSSLRVPGFDWLYAAGDCNHRALLTHMGKYQARVCGDVIVARSKGPVQVTPWSAFSADADEHAVPQVVFCDPEVAAVGMTEQQAREAGLEVKTAEYEIGSVAGAAVYADGYVGHAKMVVDQARGVIVGVTMVGPGVGEMIHAATVAVVGEVPLTRLWHAVPSYPTISEVWLRLLETYGL